MCVSLSLPSPHCCLRYIYRTKVQCITIFLSKGVEPNRQHISHFVPCCKSIATHASLMNVAPHLNPCCCLAPLFRVGRQKRYGKDWRPNGMLTLAPHFPPTTGGNCFALNEPLNSTKPSTFHDSHACVAMFFMWLTKFQ